MMKKILLAGLATGVMMLGISGPAFATIITGSFSGVVTYDYGNHPSDLFGLGAGTSMTGQAITGTFSYDSGGYSMDHDNIYRLNSDGATYNYSNSPSVAPSMTITDTINGHSVTTTSVARQEVSVTQNYNYGDGVTTSMFNIGSYVSGNQYANVSTGPMFYSNTTILGNIWDVGTANFSVSTPGSDLSRSSGQYYDGSGSDVYNVGFSINSISAGPASGPSPAPVPEPATTLLVGMGLVGFIGVCRRKKA